MRVMNSHPRIWHKKAFFLQQMQFEQLAELTCAFDGTKLNIHHRGIYVVSGDMDSDDGVAEIDASPVLLATRSPARHI